MATIISSIDSNVRDAFRQYAIKIGNQPRDGVSIDVGWTAVDILRIEDPEREIRTKGVGPCYVMFGENMEGDIILGHYTHSTPREVARESARALLEQENTKGKRPIRWDTFDFNFLPGPISEADLISKRLSLPHYNVSYTKNGELKVDTIWPPAIQIRK